MRPGWGTMALLALCAALGQGNGPAQAPDAPLVQLEAKTLGDARFDITFEEVGRTASTSTIRVIHRQGGPTGSAMFVVRGMYLVSKARHAEYFISLKEWSEADGSRMYLVGFTDTRDAGVAATFGAEYAGTAKKEYLSVSQFAPLFEKPASGPIPAPSPPPSAAGEPAGDFLMPQLRVAAEAYRQEFGQWPPEGNLPFRRAMTGDNPRKIVFMEFEGKSIGGGGELVDSWGTPYRMSVAEGKALTISSAGPDREFGTGDDIVVRVPGA